VYEPAAARPAGARVADGRVFERKDVDGVVVVRVVTPRFRVDEAERVLAQAIPKTEGGPAPRVVLDLTGVEFIDSGALSVIWRINERTSLRLAGLGPLVLNTFRILGMLAILAHDETGEQALAALREQGA
jgi:anti-anti-sigma factor